MNSKNQLSPEESKYLIQLVANMRKKGFHDSDFLAIGLSFGTFKKAGEGVGDKSLITVLEIANRFPFVLTGRHRSNSIDAHDLSLPPKS